MFNSREQINQEVDSQGTTVLILEAAGLCTHTAKKCCEKIMLWDSEAI